MIRDKHSRNYPETNGWCVTPKYKIQHRVKFYTSTKLLPEPEFGFGIL